MAHIECIQLSIGNIVHVVCDDCMMWWSDMTQESSLNLNSVSWFLTVSLISCFWYLITLKLYTVIPIVMTTSALCERGFSPDHHTLWPLPNHWTQRWEWWVEWSDFLTNCRLRWKLESYLRVQLCVSECVSGSGSRWISSVGLLGQHFSIFGHFLLFPSSPWILSAFLSSLHPVLFFTSASLSFQLSIPLLLSFSQSSLLYIFPFSFILFRGTINLSSSSLRLKLFLSFVRFAFMMMQRWNDEIE